MKKTLLGMGLLVFLAYSVIDRFVTPLSDWIAIPMMLIAVILIIAGGGLKRKPR